MTRTAFAARRSLGCRRGSVVLVGALLVTVISEATEASAREPHAPQPLVVLVQDHVARSRPSLLAPAIETVAVRRPLTGLRTILVVVGRATSTPGREWVRVRLPGRPNGHLGWITVAQTRPAITDWSIEVALDARRVTITRGGAVQRRFRAVVGKPSTPTPLGRFFVEEAVALAPGDPGSPFALATSARSEVLQEFSGGPGQIAIHGTSNLAADPLGTAASHGCVRVSTRAITWIVARIGRGVPVTITR